MIEIQGSEVRHIRRVLRLDTGDEIVVFDGSGKDYRGIIVKGGSSSVVIQIQNISPSRKESHLGITLAQSLLKGEKMDYLIQKATELGVKKIIPFFSSRSNPLLERTKRMNRHHRWEKIAIGASKQCGRGMVPEIEPLKDYSEMLRTSSRNFLCIMLCEKEGKRLREILSKSKEKMEICFVVGPEGGFSHEEVMAAKEKGFIPVTLGERILRAETASLCLLSILQYEWGDMG